MRRSLLDLLCCADCRSESLEATTFEETKRPEGTPEVFEGLIACGGCGSRFPVIAGIPRMLPSGLRNALERYHEDFFARHPEARSPVGDTAPPPEIVRTFDGFSHQHVELNEGTVEAERWRETFLRSIPVDAGFFSGKRGVDVGCGYGRHAYWAARFGAEIVGVDLSEAVSLARRHLSSYPHSDVVQADVFHFPFRGGVFDFAYSIGVLHHTPDPRRAFRSVLPSLKSGGRVMIWVYALEGMRWWYRVSHLTWLRRVTNRLPRRAQMAVTGLITAGLEAVIWFPCRILKRVPGGEKWVEKIPLGDGCERPWLDKFRSVFDRIQPPVTYYHTTAELREWLSEGGLQGPTVYDTDGRGLVAAGTKV